MNHTTCVVTHTHTHPRTPKKKVPQEQYKTQSLMWFFETKIAEVGFNKT
jgi:hypothetical protein